LALSGHHQHPEGRTLAPLGLLQPATRAKQAEHTATCSRNRPACPGWRPVHQSHPPSTGADPHRSNLCHSVLVRASFCLLHARAHHDVVLSLPSQQPSDGLFSPMEVQANHLPMCTDPLVPVRRVWSCTSKTTPSMGSLVLDIIAM
jgi:hypothetical protein